MISKTRKAGARQRSGLQTISNCSPDKAFYNPNHTRVTSLSQCIKCGSDYTKFAVDGYCQRCQQRVEYIIRERRSTNLPYSAGYGGEYESK